MTVELGVVMDPIEAITVKKDTTLALLLAAQKRGWRLLYMEMGDLGLRDGAPQARMRELEVCDDPGHWFSLGAERARPLESLDVILMRKDPPFDIEYLYATHILEQAEARGALVINKPRSLRDANEKLFTIWFNECCPETLVTRRADQVRAFLEQHGEIIVKPLDGMGGESVFRVAGHDPNVNVIIETLTRRGSRYAMAQRCLPEIAEGDKRILMIAGEPLPYALARMPMAGESRGNLAAGGTGAGRELSARDRWIAARVGPELVRRGLVFVGLDVIGDYLTEINVTSPTCVRELDRIYGLDIGSMLMDRIAQSLPRGEH